MPRVFAYFSRAKSDRAKGFMSCVRELGTGSCAEGQLAFEAARSRAKLY